MNNHPAEFITLEASSFDVEMLDKAKKHVLASCLVYPEVAYAVYNILKPEHFTGSHRIVYELIYNKVRRSIENREKLELTFNSVVADLELSQIKAHVDIGTYLEYAIDKVEFVTATAIKLKEIALRTKFEQELAALQISQPNTPLQDVLHSAKHLISNIENELVQSSEALTAADLANEVLSYIEDSSVPIIYKLGIPDVDRTIIDFAPGNTVVIGARPSVGKTSLSIFSALKNAMEGIPVHFFSLEMPPRQLGAKVLNFLTKISSKKILKKDLTYDEKKKLYNATKTLETLPVKFTSYPDMPLSTLMQGIRDSRLKYGTQMVFVDYLQLINYSLPNRGRNQEVAYIAQQLKSAAIELDVCIVELSQLSRNDKAEPTMSDLKESGDIEQAASYIALMWEESSTEFKELKAKGIQPIWFKVDKQRNGEKGRFMLNFHQAEMQFTAMEIDPEEFEVREQEKKKKRRRNEDYDDLDDQ